jgi:hypothetical protein
MHHYLVTWSIDIGAKNPQEAAEKARACQVRRGTIAGVFDVFEPDSGPITRPRSGRKLATIDLIYPEETIYFADGVT